MAYIKKPNYPFIEREGFDYLQGMLVDIFGRAGSVFQTEGLSLMEYIRACARADAIEALKTELHLFRPRALVYLRMTPPSYKPEDTELLITLHAGDMMSEDRELRMDGALSVADIMHLALKQERRYVELTGTKPY